MKIPKYFLVVLLTVTCVYTGQAQHFGRKPKLVVNLVVSQMRADYVDRFYDNFSHTGFRVLFDEGTYFTNARYNYMATNSVAGLATISTGANPAEHGIISERWIDFTTNIPVGLLDDPDVLGLHVEGADARYSPRHLTAATVGDQLKAQNPDSKVVSVALNPSSAIVSGGMTADAYWFYPKHGSWVSSTFYFRQLPHWVEVYNHNKPYSQYLDRPWEASKSYETYYNTEHKIIDFGNTRRFFAREFFRGVFSGRRNIEALDIEAIQYTPFGNSLVTQFAREVITHDKLGEGDRTDMITVCYDSPRYIGEFFGPGSIEIEDTYYKLDLEIGELLNFVFSKVGKENVVVVLTSDHGTSDTYRENSRVSSGLFNVGQFMMIMNGFLSAQYEPGNWVVDYKDRQVYLNREMIYKYGFDLQEIQTRAAAFALQFRGVSGAFTSTSLQHSYFGSGFGEKVQNSFYARRSGDLTLNLMPGWIEDEANVVSNSGSLYQYDTHVPLVFLGHGIRVGKVERDVDMRSVAPTLARIMQVNVPNASTGEVLNEALAQ